MKEKDGLPLNGKSPFRWRRRRDSKDARMCHLENKLPPVAYLSLFRYSNTLEKFLIICGLVSAFVQGSAMPLMVLVLGRMTDKFVEFTSCFTNGRINSTIVDDNISSTDCNTSVELSHRFQELEDVMTSFALYYIIVGCVVILTGFIQVYTLVLSSTRQARRIRSLFFQAVMRQEMEWIDSREAGELNSRLNEDVSKIEEAIGDKLTFFANNLSAATCGLVIGFVNGWSLTLIVLATAPLLGGAAALVGKFLSSWAVKEMKAYARAGCIVENVLRNIRTVVAYGAEGKEVERYNEKLGEAEKQGVRKGMVIGTFRGFIWCLVLLSFALAFWYGSTLALDPGTDFSIGRLMTVCFSIIISAFNIGHASSTFDIFLTGRCAAATVFHVIDKKSKIDPLSDDGIILDKMRGEIIFHNVGFHYLSRTQTNVLDGYTVTFHPDQIYALAGPSGTGKSTVLRLMQRLYDPCSGKITIDGEDMTNLSVRWLRRLFGVVQQEPTLFATTISDNIRLGSESPTDEDVIKAAKAANAYDFIMDMPEKFDTLVGIGGCQLSGGQKQRIAIARALVRNPKILLLDQACSALDNHSEAVVMENLTKARVGRTTILVAHKRSTLQTADHVIMMEFCTTVPKAELTYVNEEELEASHKFDRGNDKLGQNNEGFISEYDDADENLNKLRHNDFNGMTKHRKTNNTQRPSDASTSSESYINQQERNSLQVYEGDQHLLTNSTREGHNNFNEDKEAEPGTASRLLRMNLSEYPYITLGSIGALITGAMQPGFAVLLSAIIGVYSLPNNVDKQADINLYCILMAALSALSFFAHFLQHSMFSKSGEILTRRIRRMTFSAILRQDMSWFDEHTKGSSSLSSRLSTDAGLIQGAAGVQVGFSVSVGSSVILALVIALYSGWKLALVQIAFFPIVVGSQAAKTRMEHATTIRDQKTLENAGRVVLETLNAFETVTQLGKEQYFASKYDQILRAISRNGNKSAITQGVLFGFVSSILCFSYGATFRYGAVLIGTKEMTFESMFRVYFVIIFAGLSLGRAYRYMPDYSKAKKAASGIFELMDRKPSIDVYDSEAVTSEDFNKGLQLKSCDFTYTTRPDCQVLQDLDIEIEGGKTLALVGRSGCGKSTVVQMILRFYDPKKGSVFIGGQDVKSQDLKFLRSKIGVVFQDPVLFEGSIYDNITYGDLARVPTMSEVEEAAKAANIHEFIIGLEKGYHTAVGHGGSRLSRGQKQRIAIARALVRNPTILLMDEATSSLDRENEKIVQEALDRARKGRTSIMIAHRLSTIQNADKIAVMSKGCVVESGTHDSLMEKRGAYFDMVNAGVPLT